MRRVLHFFAWCCFPRTWRARYGRELHALIDDLSPRWLDLVDIVREGVQMRMTRSYLLRNAAAVGIVGALIGGIAAFAAPARFESRGTMTATPVGNDDQTAVVNRLRAIIGRATEAAFGAGPVPTAHIAITRGSGPNEIHVSYVDADPRRAQEMAQLVLTRAIEANVETGGQPVNRSPGLQLRITTPPQLPDSPARPYLVWLVGAGFGFGAVLGAAGGVWRRREQPGA